MAEPVPTITLRVQLSDGSCEIIDTTGPRVGHVKDDIIAKFKRRFKDVDPGDLHLSKLGDDGGLTRLDPFDMLTKAGLDTGVTVVVELTVAAAAPAQDVTGAVSGDAGGVIHTLEDVPILPSTAPVARVVAELRAGKYAIKEGSGHVDLLDDSLRWPNATNNVLFVRQVYPHLYEKVLGECKQAAPLPGKSAYDQEKAQRRIITGQPGIGKSVFGWYIIFRVLTEQPGRTIVYSSSSANQTYIIPPTGPVRVVSNVVFGLDMLENMQGLGSDVLLIADSLLPPPLPFPTVVISSPGRLAPRHLRDTLHHYSKPRFYMPIPSEQEVLELHKVAFSSLPREGVLQRMELWGPIPRNVLVDVDDDAQNDEITRSQSVDEDVLVALAIAEDGAGPPVHDAPHRILHERAAGQDAEPGSPEADPASAAYYRRGKVVIASLPFLRHVIDRLMYKQKWKAAFLVDVSAGIGPLGALRGIKFEEVVLDLLAGGISLKARDLRSSQDLAAPIVFPPAARVGWTQAGDLETHRSAANSLLVPHDRNKAGLDALVWREGASHHEPLDSTVSESHGLHARGLARALAGLGWTPHGGWPQSSSAHGRDMQIRYFWAVPEERFDGGWRTSQPRKDKKLSEEDASADAAASESAAAAAFKHVAQHALCIPRAVVLARVAQLCKDRGVKLPSDFLSSSAAGARSSRGDSGAGAGATSDGLISTVAQSSSSGTRKRKLGQMSEEGFEGAAAAAAEASESAALSSSALVHIPPRRVSGTDLTAPVRSATSSSSAAAASHLGVSGPAASSTLMSAAAAPATSATKRRKLAQNTAERSEGAAAEASESAALSSSALIQK